MKQSTKIPRPVSNQQSSKMYVFISSSNLSKLNSISTDLILYINNTYTIQLYMTKYKLKIKTVLVVYY